MSCMQITHTQTCWGSLPTQGGPTVSPLHPKSWRSSCSPSPRQSSNLGFLGSPSLRTNPALFLRLPCAHPPKRLECDESPGGLTMPPTRASLRALLWSYPCPGGNPPTPALPGERWVFTEAIHDSQDIQPHPCIDGWMGKEATVHIHKGIVLSHKKNEIMPFPATWMGLDTITLSEVRQTQKGSIMISLIRGT